jgi:hypothetical protein
VIQKGVAAMDAPMSEGIVTVNAEGKRYAASFRIERGVITVTSGSVSTTIELHDVISPQSVARTILRAMVREGPCGQLVECAGTESSRGTAETNPGQAVPRLAYSLRYWQGLRG